MKFVFIQPSKTLAPYVTAFWLFESSSGIPRGESSIVVPNGNARIVIPYKNSLTVTSADRVMTSKDQDIFLAGIWDQPAMLSSYVQETGTIGIDLSPKGLYRLFDLNMNELSNKMYEFSDLFGFWGQRMRYELGLIAIPSQKVSFLDKALVHLLRKNEKDFSLLDFLVDSIVKSNGSIEVNSLAEETGYSRRYINKQFNRYIGVSPKTFSNITRFKFFYKQWARTKSEKFFENDLYTYYYDQSHFIKEFKRFTGYSPLQYAKMGSDFSRSFHSQR